MTCKSVEADLEKFRENYHSVRVNVFSDCLVYRCGKGKAQKGAKEANDLIEELQLPLVAITNKFPSDDSYVIKSQDSSDI